MAPNPRNFRAEYICKATDCPSHFEAPGWEDPTPGAIAGHFHHRMLSQPVPGAHVAVTGCGVCGHAGAIEVVRVPKAYLFAQGRIGLAPALEAAVGDDGIDLTGEGNAARSDALRASLRAQVLRIAALHVTGKYEGDPEDAAINRGIAQRELEQQKDPASRQRILSFWELPNALAHLDRYGGLYVLTEAGRHMTTIAFREEY